MPPRRGEVWFVQFDPQVGAEIKKLRPAVVISVAGLERLPLAVVVPLTGWKTHYATFPWFVNILPTTMNGLTKESGADAFQVKSVSTARFHRRIGVLPEAQSDAIAAGIALVVGYRPPLA